MCYCMKSYNFKDFCLKGSALAWDKSNFGNSCNWDSDREILAAEGVCWGYMWCQDGLWDSCVYVESFSSLSTESELKILCLLIWLLINKNRHLKLFNLQTFLPRPKFSCKFSWDCKFIWCCEKNDRPAVGLKQPYSAPRGLHGLNLRKSQVNISKFSP